MPNSPGRVPAAPGQLAGPRPPAAMPPGRSYTTSIDLASGKGPGRPPECQHTRSDDKSPRRRCASGRSTPSAPPSSVRPARARPSVGRPGAPCRIGRLAGPPPGTGPSPRASRGMLPAPGPATPPAAPQARPRGRTGHFPALPSARQRPGARAWRRGPAASRQRAATAAAAARPRPPARRAGAPRAAVAR